MHGHIEKSINQKFILTLIHLTSILLGGWVLFYGGWNFIYSIFGKAEHNTSILSRIIIFALQLIYFIRLCLTSFIFQKRKMEWQEVIEVGSFLFIIQIFFAILTLYHKAEITLYDFLWVALYFIGSCLNTCSEWQRLVWKKESSNKGKLFTSGLFKYAMHINYFGDSVLFTGLALLTGSFWALSIPLVMTISFIFLHIPLIDKYLESRYKDSYTVYSQKTKKLIPWIY